MGLRRSSRIHEMRSRARDRLELCSPPENYGLLWKSKSFDRESANLGGVANAGLPDLDDLLGDNLREWIVAFPQAEGV
jgi:hypothetical protein